MQRERFDSGVDDFRAIVDYGDTFTEGEHFSIGLYEIGMIGGAEPTTGIQVGNITDTSVLGSGDYGEIGSLGNIPLTSDDPPSPGDPLVSEPLDTLYIYRDTTGGSAVDYFDTSNGFPRADFSVLTEIGTAVSVTDGPSQLLFAVGTTTGFGSIDPVEGTFVDIGLPGESGTNVDLTNLPGDDRIFIVCDSTDTPIDTYDTATGVFTATAFNIHSVTVSTPVGVTDGDDGLLYIAGQDEGFASVDPQSGVVTDVGIEDLSGTNADLTNLPGDGRIFIVRDTSGDTAVDTYDTETGAFVGDAVVIASYLDSPVAITDGNDGMLYVLGSDGGFGAIDPADLTFTRIGFPDLPGDNEDITNMENAPLLDSDDDGVPSK